MNLPFLLQRDRILPLSTAVVVSTFAVVALRLYPVGRALRFFERTARRRLGERSGEGSTPCGVLALWAVRAAGRRVPGVSCLVQAMVGRWMLAGCGFDSEIVIGVARPKGEGLVAHAWLEVDGATVLGGPGNRSRYTVLPGLPAMIRGLR